MAPTRWIQEIRRRQNRNIVKRRHLQEVPIARDQTIRFSHQRRLEQLVIIRIATSELRASDRNPFRDRFELSQIDRSDFPATYRSNFGRWKRLRSSLNVSSENSSTPFADRTASTTVRGGPSGRSAALIRTLDAVKNNALELSDPPEASSARPPSSRSRRLPHPRPSSWSDAPRRRPAKPLIVLHRIITPTALTFLVTRYNRRTLRRYRAIAEAVPGVHAGGNLSHKSHHSHGHHFTIAPTVRASRARADLLGSNVAQS